MNCLEPDVREMRFTRCDAEKAGALGDVCCEGDKEGDDGVLEDGDPCFLVRVLIYWLCRNNMFGGEKDLHGTI